MKLSRLLIGVWAALASNGCNRSGAVTVGTAGTRWQFSRAENTLFAYGGGARVSSWNIAGKNVVWEKPLGLNTWLTQSGSGDHVGIVSQRNPGEDVRFTVLRAGDGAKVSELELGRVWQHSFATDEDTFVALSHDASWAAFSLTDGVEKDSLCLAPLPSGKFVFFTEHTNAVGKLAFDPRALRVAVGWRSPPYWLDVYDHAGSEWKRVQRWDNSACPSWTPRGLMFVREDGLHVYDGGKDLLAVRGSFMGSPRSDVCGSFSVSPDGAWMLSWAGWELSVSNITTGATVLRHAWEKKQPTGICSSGFSGNRMRVFTCSGLLLEFDLAKAALVKTEDLGPPDTSDKGISFHEGASRVALYTVMLSPSGDWIWIRKLQGQPTLRRL